MGGEANDGCKPVMSGGVERRGREGQWVWDRDKTGSGGKEPLGASFLCGFGFSPKIPQALLRAIFFARRAPARAK